MAKKTKKKGASLINIIIIVIVTAVISGVIVGSAVYSWQQKINEEVKYSLDEKIKGLTISLNQSLESQSGMQENLEAVKAGASDKFDIKTEKCYQKGCLFNQENSNYPLGVSTIKGYYTQVERTAWDETLVCDDFVVTNGPEELISNLVELVEIGNKVHSLNEEGQPVINLDFQSLTEDEQEKISDSTKDKQVELIVFSPSPPNAGVSACHPEVEVLRVK